MHGKLVSDRRAHHLRSTNYTRSGKPRRIGRFLLILYPGHAPNVTFCSLISPSTVGNFIRPTRGVGSDFVAAAAIFIATNLVSLQSPALKKVNEYPAWRQLTNQKACFFLSYSFHCTVVYVSIQYFSSDSLLLRAKLLLDANCIIMFRISISQEIRGSHTTVSIWTFPEISHTGDYFFPFH